MLTVQNLSIVHQSDLRPLVEGLSFHLSGQERLAVIGEEGDGKSTLLKALYDPRLVEGWATVSGSVSRSGERLGYVSQELTEEENALSAYGYLSCSDAFLELQPGQLRQLCGQLGLDSALCWSDTPMALLSGGEKVRLRLLRCLAEQPTLLLLDEPGNDLDVDALQLLERYLLSCRLPVLYVSHDETLLRHTATAVLHLESLHRREQPRWTLARVPYGAYVDKRASSMERQAQLYQAEKRQERARQEKLNRIQSAVDYAQEHISRGDPHGARLLKKKMKAVKSMEHRYQREQQAATPRPEAENAIQAFFQQLPALPAGRGVLNLSLPELRAGDRLLATQVELRLRGPEKVLLIGPNGSGKTTLLRAALAALRDSPLRVACMPQRYEEQLPQSLSPLDFLDPAGEKETRTRVRTLLGSLKFAPEEMLHPISDLSGGQKAKVLLLSLILSRPEVLVMDEPTRNLSPLSAPVMRQLICTFPGAVLCVTHDRVLMAQWPGRILHLAENGLTEASTEEENP